MSLSSSEIKAVVEELKFLEESYFSKMQFIDDRIYRLRFKTGDVIINPAEELHLTEYKLVGRPPDANLRFVRKVLKGIKLKKVFQKDTDRIVVFEFEGDYKIIVELFGKGNLMLVDPDGLTRYALEYRSWKGRDIKPKKPYSFPPSKEPNVEEEVEKGISKRLDKEFAKNFKEEIVDDKLGRMLSTQEKAGKEMEKSIEENRLIGDWIYANLNELGEKFEAVKKEKNREKRLKIVKELFGKKAEIQDQVLIFDV